MNGRKIVASESRRGVKGSELFTQTAGEIAGMYNKAWGVLRDRELNVLEYFWSWEKKSSHDTWKREYDFSGPSFVDVVVKHGTFERIFQHSSAVLHGKHYVKMQYLQVLKTYRAEYLKLRDPLGMKYKRTGLPSWDMYLSMVLGMFYNLELRKRIAELVEQISDVWLVPHWVRLQTVPVVMADGQVVPFFMLCAVIHDQMRHGKHVRGSAGRSLS